MCCLFRCKIFCNLFCIGAEADVAKMYIFENNAKTFGPFYSLEETTEVYNRLKKSNPILVNYNEYDF